MKTLIRCLVSLVIGRDRRMQWHGVILTVAIVSTPLAAAAEPSSYSFGALPQFSPAQMEEVYSSVAAELSHAIGRIVVFRTASSFDKYFQNLKAQSYDVVLIPAFYYVPAVDEFGYLPLARVSEPLKGVVVVPDQSAIRNVGDLQDKIIATTPRNAPAVILGEQALRARGLTEGRNVTYKETKTAETCLQQTLAGTTQACVAASFGVAIFQQSTGVKLRTVLETTPLPGYLVAAHKRMPASERDRIQAAILGWQGTPAGKAVLKSLNTQGFVATTDADYESLRAFIRTLEKPPWLPSAP